MGFVYTWTCTIRREREFSAKPHLPTNHFTCPPTLRENAINHKPVVATSNTWHHSTEGSGSVHSWLPWSQQSLHNSVAQQKPLSGFSHKGLLFTRLERHLHIHRSHKWLDLARDAKPQKTGCHSYKCWGVYTYIHVHVCTIPLVQHVDFQGNEFVGKHQAGLLIKSALVRNQFHGCPLCTTQECP